MAERKKPLRWRKEPDEQGLASIGQAARGWDLRRDGEELAVVRPIESPRFCVVAWYFYGSVGDKSYNSFNDKKAWKTPEAAKAAAEKWVRTELDISSREAVNDA